MASHLKNCSFCDEQRVFERAIRSARSGSRIQCEKSMVDLIERLRDVEFDLDYKQALLSGRWPGAVEILEWSLVKAREYEMEQQKLEQEEAAERTARISERREQQEKADEGALARAIENGLIDP